MSGYLPIAFTTKMKSLLGEEFDRFMSSYGDPRVYGIRINRLKLGAEEWKSISPMGGAVRPIPWAPVGFYYEEGARPGKHPHYHAGLYYIQEPSAMAPVELLDVRPGHRVLDLCAAPGGKSTQIAANLQGSGVLVSNDNARERTKALAKNIELAGVRNAVVLNEEPSALAPVFLGWFDRILVDAPCSGEGMFRKDESMIAEWEKHSIERCSVMQRHILRDAAAMLAPGGVLVYSTCTFSPEENEAQIAELLAEYPDFEVRPVRHQYGWKPGHPEWAGEAGEVLSAEQSASLAGTVRLWPHHIEGEGHYAAVLTRKGATPSEERQYLEPPVLAEKDAGKRKKVKGNAGAALRAAEKKGGRATKDSGKLQRTGSPARQSGKGRQPEVVDAAAAWHAFAEQELSGGFAGTGSMLSFGSRIYLQPEGMPPLDGLHVVRAGWYVGEAGRNRFEPSQALAMGLRPSEAVRSLNFASDDPDIIRYLKGETLFVEAHNIKMEGNPAQPLKGYVLVCTDGYPVGWGKYTGDGMLKNELPVGWRWM